MCSPRRFPALTAVLYKGQIQSRGLRLVLLPAEVPRCEQGNWIRQAWPPALHLVRATAQGLEARLAAAGEAWLT